MNLHAPPTIALIPRGTRSGAVEKRELTVEAGELDRPTLALLQPLSRTGRFEQHAAFEEWSAGHDGPSEFWSF